MNKKKLALLLFLVSLCNTVARADAAPEPGYTSVSVNLILQTEDDFPGHRFFLQSPIDVEEITVRKGETVISSDNRGGAKRYATLVAVPRTAFPLFETREDEMKWLGEQLRGKKLDGAVELAKHSFQRHIRVSEKAGWKDPVYKLEKDEGKGLKVTAVEGQGSGGGSVTFGLYEVERSFTPAFYSLVIGGLLLSGAVIFLGVWFLRGRRRNNAV